MEGGERDIRGCRAVDGLIIHPLSVVKDPPADTQAGRWRAEGELTGGFGFS